MEKHMHTLRGGITPERRASIRQQVGSRLGQPFAFGFVNNRELNPRLRGWIKYRTFKNMATNSHIVNTGVTLYLDMVMKSKWKFMPAVIEGNPMYEQAKMYAELAKQILVDDPKTQFQRIVGRAAMFRFNGYSCLNWWVRRREDGIITIVDISERLPETIEEIDSDENGEVTQFVQRMHTGQYGVIPVSNTVYLVDDSLHTEPEGTGLFRSLYPYWEDMESYRNLQAIGYERDMRGVMKAWADIEGEITKAEETLGEGATDEEIMAVVMAKIKPIYDFVRLQRKDKQTSIVMDGGVAVGERADGSTQAIAVRKNDVAPLEVEDMSFDDMEVTLKRIEREMALIMGIQQVMLGDGSRGSWSLAKEQADEFGVRVSSSIDMVVDAFREQILKRIFMLNGWPMEMIPTITAEMPDYVSIMDKAKSLKDLEELDVRDPVHDVLRAEMRLPPVPESLKQEKTRMQENSMGGESNDPSMEKGKKGKKKKTDTMQKDLL